MRLSLFAAENAKRSGSRSRLRVELLEDRLVPTVYNVNSLADILNPTAGVVTLRSAIQAADGHADPTGNTINLTVPGLYRITNPGTNLENNQGGAFTILPTANLSIINTSGGTTTVEGGGYDRVFDINPGDTSNPATKFTVTMQGFTIEGGVAHSVASSPTPDGADASGGGIRDQGNTSLTLTNMVITNNTATADGGGVSMENVVSTPWTLTLNNSTISFNHCGDAGGGVDTDGSGKVFLNAGTVINGNTSVNQGAGVWLDAIASGPTFQSANLTVTSTLVENNTAFAAANVGGGIGNAGNGKVTILDSTILNNYANGVGGGYGEENNQDTLTVLNSSFLNNTANGTTGTGGGGGIFEADTTVINDSTFTGNSSLTVPGGGIDSTAATFTINNTVVAGNFANDVGGMNFLGTAPDIFATVTAGVGNFIGSGDSDLTGLNPALDNRIGTATAPLASLLGPLQNNGGPTPTRTPLAGSPLIDTGVNNAIPAGTTTDQRGTPRIINNVVDVGAVEDPPTAFAVIGTTLQITSADNAQNVSVRLKSGDSHTLEILSSGSVVGSFATSSFTSINVRLGGNDSLTIDSSNGNPVPTGGLSYNGGSGSNTLVGPNGPTTWSITGSNSGTLSDGVTFTNVENVTGGTGNDSFAFHNGGSVSGTINGGGGSDTVDNSAVASAVVVNLGSLANIGTVIGGKSFSNTLVGANTGNTWNITGTDSGTVNGVTFSDFMYLTGGSGNDSFKFLSGGSVGGNINGGSGSNTLDYSGYGQPIKVRLNSMLATGLNLFGNITAVVGSTAATNTLIGPNSTNTWAITGANAGTLNGSFTFSSIENLTGGSGNNLFHFSRGGSLVGTINGGSATAQNTLDYSALSTGVTVNLSTNTASLTAGVSNITGVLGGAGNNTLTGSNTLACFLEGGAGNDALKGGSARAVLIGAGGTDTLTGGTGDDILIGDNTTADANIAALDAILAEWASTDSYSTRISKLMTADLNTTVTRDNNANALNGGSGTDWFFSSTGDILKGVQTGATVTTI
jgi:hypothetical protein